MDGRWPSVDRQDDDHAETHSAQVIQRVYRGHLSRHRSVQELMKQAGPTFRKSWKLNRIREEMASLGFKNGALLTTREELYEEYLKWQDIQKRDHKRASAPTPKGAGSKGNWSKSKSGVFGGFLSPQVIESPSADLLVAKLDEMMAQQRKLERDVLALQAGSAVRQATAAAQVGKPSSGSSAQVGKPSSSSSASRSLAFEERSPVIFGDFLVIKDKSGDRGGFVNADAATLNCGVQRSPPDGSDSLVFDNYVFQVIPHLNYRSRREQEERREMNLGSKEDMAEDAVLAEYVKKEDDSNARTMEKVRSGGLRTTLRYGMVVEIVHWKTGKFLHCHNTAARRDSSCRKVSLRDLGGAASQFKLKPRFKAQTDNSVVFYGHNVVFESVRLPGMFLHTSLESNVTREEAEASKMSSPPPRCLRGPSIFELNISSESASYIFSRFAPCEPKSTSELHTSLCPFRLFHSQSESFFSASCDPDKNDRSGNSHHDPLDIFTNASAKATRLFEASKSHVAKSPVTLPMSRKLKMVSRSISDGVSSPKTSFLSAVRAARKLHESSEDDEQGGDEPDDGLTDNICRGLPAHIPYLNPIEVDANETTDSTNPKNHNAKQIWAFETENRSACKAVCYGDQVRVRHVPSGRYLAVDTSDIMHSASRFDDWYRCYLVDDATDDADLLENSELGTWAPPEALLFALEGEGVQDGAILPLEHSTVRLVHHWDRSEDGLPDACLYLHNTDMQKPPCRIRSGARKPKQAESLMVVFSTARSAEDDFSLIPVPFSETKLVHCAKAYLPHAWAYTRRVTDIVPLVDLGTIEATDMTRMLLGLIGMLAKGKSELDPAEDWVKKANSLMPKEFSALFDAEANKVAQGICRDLKVMDAIFAMSVAPYARKMAGVMTLHMIDKPFGVEGSSEQLEKKQIKAVQKFVHASLQRMFASNNASQLYFGRRALPVTEVAGHMSFGIEASSIKTWMDSLKKQTVDPQGAAVTLTKLLSSNRKLFDAHCSPPLVHEFACMIRDLGPQPRLVSFFEAICMSEGKPVMTNQEMVLRMLWLNDDARENLFIELESKSAGTLDVEHYLPVKYSPNGEPFDHDKASLSTAKKFEEMKEDYLGKKEVGGVGIFPVVFVRWSGTTEWAEGMQNALWYTAESMGIKTHDNKGTASAKPLVRIEALCWVLEPERLCLSVTKQAFQPVIDGDKSPRANQFKWHKQLAQYFVAQLKMLVTMCFGRSYNVISALEKSFQYPILASIATNSHLPSEVRAVAMDLARVLFVDRYPQMPNCGCPCIPRQLWIFDDGSGGGSGGGGGRSGSGDSSSGGGGGGSSGGRLGGAGLKSIIDSLHHRGHGGKDDSSGSAQPVIPVSVSVDDASVPLIRRAALSDDNALPGFIIGPRHYMKRHANPLMSFPSHFKFFLLRKCTNDLIEGFGEKGRMAHDQKALNQMATAAMNLINELINFGFQSTLKKVKDMVPGLVKLLDGRSDVKSLNIKEVEHIEPASARYEHFEPASAQYEHFEPASARYEQTSNSLVVTGVKCVILDALITISNFRTQFRLGQLLERFKVLTQTPAFAADLAACHDAAIAHGGSDAGSGAAVAASGPLATWLFDQFESLFETEEGKGLELYTLAGHDCDAVLIDCLMYEDDALTAKALELLERTYTQRRLLINAVENVILLPYPAFKASPSKALGGELEDYGAMHSAIDFLAYAVRSAPVWAVASDLSGVIDRTVEEKCSNTARLLLEFLREPTAKSGWRDRDEEEEEAHRDGTASQSLGSHRAITIATLSMATGAQLRPNNAHHQDILRAMGLVPTLQAALTIDCNVSFKKHSVSYAAARLADRSAVPSAPTTEALMDLVDSRRTLVTLVKDLVEVLAEFVRNHPKNQAAVLGSALPDLRRLLQGVPAPLLDGGSGLEGNKWLQAQIEASPSVGAEFVIIECYRGNAALCQTIPRDLFPQFGGLLNDAPDVSASPLLDFFLLACDPYSAVGVLAVADTDEEVAASTWERNQNLTVDVLLNARWTRIRACIANCFDDEFTDAGTRKKTKDRRATPTSFFQDDAETVEFPAVLPEPKPSGHASEGLQVRPPQTSPLSPRALERSHHGAPLQPGRLVELLCGCIEGGNYASASRLQSQEITLEITVATLASRLNNHLSTGDTLAPYTPTADQEVFVATDDFSLRLVELMALQVAALVLDPKILRSGDLWAAVALGAKNVLGGAASLLAACLADSTMTMDRRTESMIEAVLPLALPCLRMCRKLIGDAHAHGADDSFGPHASTLGRSTAIKQQPQPSSTLLDTCHYLITVLKGTLKQCGRDTGRLTARDASHDRLAAAVSALAAPLIEAALSIDHLLKPRGAAVFETIEDPTPPRTTITFAPVSPSSLKRSASTPSSPPSSPAGHEPVRRHATTGHGRDKSAGKGVAAKPALPPEALLRAFVFAIKHNKSIESKLLARRFKLVRVIEGTEPPSIFSAEEQAHGANHPTAGKMAGKARATPDAQGRPRMISSSSSSIEMVSRGGRPRGMSRSADELEKPNSSAFAAFPDEAANGTARARRPRGASMAEDPGSPGTPVNGSSFKVASATDKARAAIPWSDVVSRLVRFATAHNFDSDNADCVRVYRLLTSHVLKARSKEPGSSTEPGPEVCETGAMSIPMSERYRSCQEALNRGGCTTMALSAISSHNVASPAARAALDLLQELLYAGNPVVQATILRHCATVDKEGRFLKHLRRKLEDAMGAVRRRTAQLAEASASHKNSNVALGGRGGRWLAPPIGRDLKASYDDAKGVLGVLKWMVEGHHLGLQNHLRHQPASGFGHINLVEAVLDLLALQAKHRAAMAGTVEAEGADVSNPSSELLEMTLDVLVELTQGPCDGNQVAVAKHEGALQALQHVIDLDGSHRTHRTRLSVRAQAATHSSTPEAASGSKVAGAQQPQPHQQHQQHNSGAGVRARVRAMKLRGKAMAVLTAVLEGRHNKDLHRAVAMHIDNQLLGRYAKATSSFLHDSRVHFEGHEGGRGDEGGGGRVNDLASLGEDELRACREEAVRGLVALSNTRAELELVPDIFNRGGQGDGSEDDGLGDDTLSGTSTSSALASVEERTKKVSNSPLSLRAEAAEFRKFMTATVASVEVKWNGRIELLYFPLPEQGVFLSSRTKKRFMKYVDFSSPETRMKELIKAEGDFTAEMHQVFKLATASPLFRFVHTNQVTLKRLQYGLLVLLNLNVAMALRSTSKPGIATEAYQSPYGAAISGADSFADKYNASLAITWALAVPNAIGYVLILLFTALTKVPEVLRGLDADNAKATARRTRAQAARSSSRADASQSLAGTHLSRDYRSLLLPVGLTSVTLAFGAMHDAAYPDKAGFERLFFGTPHGIILVMVDASALLFSLRKCVVVADGPIVRGCCAVADSLWALRGEAVLVFLSFNGFRNAAFFTLMLLDVASISATVQSLIMSVTTPGFQLAVVAYCFVMVALIYAAFALEYFEDKFVFDPDAHDSTRGCHSVVACFWLIMYHGVPAGSLEPVLDAEDNSTDGYIYRTVFEVSFFVLVGIILFNVITGLMVDTFSSLREEAAMRRDKAVNECFVCGLTRAAYNDLGMPSPTFDEHMGPKGHCPWNYLYFVQYLNSKDETEFSGVESYVNEMLADNSMDWVPERSSFAIQHFGFEREESGHSVERSLATLGARFEAGIKALGRKVENVEGRLQRIDAFMHK